MMKEQPDKYNELVASRLPVEGPIEEDIPRTMYDHEMFCRKSRVPGRDMLRRVLTAYGRYDREVSSEHGASRVLAEDPGCILPLRIVGMDAYQNTTMGNHAGAYCALDTLSCFNFTAVVARVMRARSRYSDFLWGKCRVDPKSRFRVDRERLKAINRSCPCRIRSQCHRRRAGPCTRVFAEFSLCNCDPVFQKENGQ